MENLEHCQTILPSVMLIQLKKVTGEVSTKNALSVAVEYTIKTYNLFSEEEIKYIIDSPEQMPSLKAKLSALLPAMKNAKEGTA